MKDEADPPPSQISVLPVNRRIQFGHVSNRLSLRSRRSERLGLSQVCCHSVSDRVGATRRPTSVRHLSAVSCRLSPDTATPPINLAGRDTCCPCGFQPPLEHVEPPGDDVSDESARCGQEECGKACRRGHSPVAPLPRRGTDAGVKVAGRGWQCAAQLVPTSSSLILARSTANVRRMCNYQIHCGAAIL